MTDENALAREHRSNRTEALCRFPSASPLGRTTGKDAVGSHIFNITQDDIQTQTPPVFGRHVGILPASWANANGEGCLCKTSFAICDHSALKVYCTTTDKLMVEATPPAVTVTGTVYVPTGVVSVVLLDDEHPLNPATNPTISSTANTAPRTTLRDRRAKPSGISKTANTIVVAVLPKTAGCPNIPVVVVVEMVSVVVCAVFAPVKLSVVGENVHAAEVGTLPQANVTVPV